MDQVDISVRRQSLIQGFIEALLQALDANSDVLVNGPMSTSFGELKLNGFVCSYTDNPFVNVLDIWFGRSGGRANHPGELRLEANVADRIWINISNHNEQFTSQQLAEWCLGRLREIEAG